MTGPFQAPQKQSPWLSNTYGACKFTVGAKLTNTINVAVQLADYRYNNIAQVAHSYVYLASTPAGLLSAVPTSSPLVIGTNGQILLIDTVGLICRVVSNASGQFDLNIIQTAGGTPYYLVVLMPDGSIEVSPLIQF
jgi:hypothetical protein